ncbi:helix-turn-helix domain-containing protein [Streptomyces sp. R28]|uniref:Helix-turn-helix domain-containing protein n=1 Tax=Streptomyces sp. R28 TaxID=3238628 RepID=A0AB39QEA5_9ACTN
MEQVGQARLTTLATAAGLPKTTARRLLEQLVELGAVERSGGVFRMGPRIFRLGASWQPSPGLLAAARRPVRELARADRGDGGSVRAGGGPYDGRRDGARRVGGRPARAQRHDLSLEHRRREGARRRSG